MKPKHKVTKREQILMTWTLGDANMNRKYSNGNKKLENGSKGTEAETKLRK